MSSTVIDYYNRQHRRDGFHVHRSRRRIMLVPIAFYMQRMSCLEEPINVLINLVVTSGIIDSWARALHTPLTAGRHEDDQLEPQKLNMHQLLGTFWICAFMLSVAKLVFLMELIGRRVPLIGGIFEYLLQ